ncbi:hypothetical protein KGD82_13690 [Nocardiopsis eucommiae]|uniref:Uncharacterized protein n=1 Tax=Nocardiopsis eucommiae TaxID=2831970 RepID=A0A975QM55_9ACTN|nr:hypothetical protein KGD82_13690 [Nocardiopsis eucommiae]
MSPHPRELPKLRDQTMRHLDDPASALRSGTGDDAKEGLDALAANLRESGLYWVASDMAALAVSSGSQLAAAQWSTADRPSERGLIVLEGGVGHMDAQGVEIPIEACAWGPHPEGCLVWLLISRRGLAQKMTRTDLTLVVEDIPPLLPVYAFTVPVDGSVPMVEIDPAVPQPVVGALAASWLLMQQPTLIDTQRERPDRAVRKAYARQGRPDPEVTLVDLRRQYVPQGQEDSEEERKAGRYRHRFVVSGHWRNQAYGKERALRRQTWIPAYVKGPDGAPMLASEKVNVWRR